jgi:hypothetical protein
MRLKANELFISKNSNSVCQNSTRNFIPPPSKSVLDTHSPLQQPMPTLTPFDIKQLKVKIFEESGSPQSSRRIKNMIINDEGWHKINYFRLRKCSKF